MKPLALEPRAENRRNIELLLLAGVMLLAVVLRYQRTGWDGISFDEMWHLTLSTGRGSPQISLPRDTLISNLSSPTSLQGALPWYAVWTHMDHAVHPPLYLTLLRLWRAAFGESDATAQWLSGTCSLAAILMLWQAARVSFGTSTALWAAAAMAVAPTQLFMAQEIRGYAMLMMWGCWCLWAVARIDVHGISRGRLFELGASVLAMMLTHYFAIGACAAVGAWAIVRLRGRALVYTMCSLAGSAVIYGIAWGPFVIAQLADAREAGDTWLAEPSTNAATLAIFRFAALPFRLLADPDLAGARWPLATGALFFLPIVMMRRFKSLLPWWLWLIASAGMILLLDIARSTRHLLYIRYLLLASPAVYVLIFALLSRLKPNWCHLASGAVIALCLWLVPVSYFADAPDYSVLERYLTRSIQRDEVLVFASGEFVAWHKEVLLLAASRAPNVWPRSIVILDKPVNATSGLAASLHGKRVCMISGPISAPIDTILPGAELLEQTSMIDARQRQFAMCYRLQMP